MAVYRGTILCMLFRRIGKQGFGISLKRRKVLSWCGTVCIRTNFVQVVRVGSFVIGSVRCTTQHMGLEKSTEPNAGA